MAAGRGVVAVLFVALIWASACGANNGTAPSPPLPGRTTFSLSGRISNSETSAAVSTALLSVVDGPNAGQSTTTDESGHYSFSALQQSGFTVSVSSSGYFPQSEGVTLTSNRTLNLSLRPQPLQIALSGRVTDAATDRSIGGAVVSINGRYRGTTDNSGQFTVVGLLDAGLNSNFTYVSAENYAADYHYIRGTTQNVHLHPLERLVAGESKLVTVAPDDTLCLNNLQDTPYFGHDHVCRSVRVSVPASGVMTLDAVSTQDGSHPLLEAEIDSEPVDYFKRNPVSFRVNAGTEVLVNVEMPADSIASETFRITTSLSQP